MNSVTDNLASIGARIGMAERRFERKPGTVRLVAVSKTFDADCIRPALKAGHRVFGENRVQEAAAKWPALRADYPDVELHLIGPLQSNKVSQAVALFDVIQTVDREKIAAALATEMKTTGRSPQLFVQVNTGRESQKAGIMPEDAVGFVNHCRTNLGLRIEGLMCIPPLEENPEGHFELLANLAAASGLESLSMGMSADFEKGIAAGATHVRVGSAIFGSR